MALGVEGVKVGCYTDEANRTGCTVIIPPLHTLGVAAVRGGAPGTREAAALGPTGAVNECHAVVLCGNSVFGLSAADGVVGWCSAHGLGLEMEVATVPVVGAAVVFDLKSKDHQRLTREAGWAACAAATEADPPMGLAGVGTGCTAGKAAGREHAVPGGQGWAVARSGAVVVGALMAVNPVGDVIDEQGRVLAGCTAPPDAPRYPYATLSAIRGWNDAAADAAAARSNTTIGCLVTNATLSKPDACRAADLAHTGIARAIDPPHTNLDGDALFLLCTGQEPSHVDLVAALGARAVAEAIRAAVSPARRLG
ncbi:MAG: P1 family peptidase [Acidimicrobiales bacterium]